MSATPAKKAKLQKVWDRNAGYPVKTVRVGNINVKFGLN